jgi:hypothetical protein
MFDALTANDQNLRFIDFLFTLEVVVYFQHKRTLLMCVEKFHLTHANFHSKKMKRMKIISTFYYYFFSTIFQMKINFFPYRFRVKILEKKKKIIKIVKIQQTDV